MTTRPGRSAAEPPPPRGRLLRRAAFGVLAAFLANTGLWSLGRAMGVRFPVEPLDAESSLEAGVVGVAVLTLGVFAAAALLLAAAFWRSRRWGRALTTVSAVLAAVSILTALTVGENAASRLFLAAMPAVAGASFVLTTVSAKRR